MRIGWCLCTIEAIVRGSIDREHSAAQSSRLSPAPQSPAASDANAVANVAANIADLMATPVGMKASPQF